MNRMMGLITTAYSVMKEAGDIFWGGWFFFTAFYASLAVIWIKEKDRTRKLAAAGYSLIVLFGLYNPVTFYICRKVFYGTKIPYFCRLFSLLPVGYVIAYALVLLIRSLKGWGKLLTAVVICLVIVLFGDCVYREPWIQKAENFQKFSNDVLQVADKVHGTRTNVCIAAPPSISTYLRQYDASLIMPYGRPEDPLPELMIVLNEQETDAGKAVELAGQEACDYVVTYKNTKNRDAFLNAGQELFAETDNYLIFSVGHIKRVKREYNEKRQVVLTAFIDENDQPYNTGSGYAATRYTYDRFGNRNSERYFDDLGKPFKVSNGSYGYQTEWDYRRLLQKRTYIDESDQPMNITQGYSSVGYTYYKNRRKKTETYYNERDEQVLLPKGYSSIYYEYADGRVSKITYRDENNAPVLTTDGYAQEAYSYDANGNINVYQFYDINGDPVTNKEGASEVRYTFNNKRQVIREEYYGLDKKLVYRPIGSAVTEKEYDDNGNVSVMRYYDDKNKPVIIVSGYAEVHRSFNDKRQIIHEQYYDTEGKLFLTDSGIAGKEFEYDPAGNIVCIRMLGLDGELKANTLGYAELRRLYNDSKQMIREEYFDISGNPAGVASDKHIAVEKVYENGVFVKDIMIYE